MSPIAGNPHDGFNYTMNINGTAVPYGSSDSDYLTDVLSNASADFIRRSVDQFPSQPFMLYIAPYTPHTPATPAPRHLSAFKGIQAPRTSSFNESDMSDKPNWIRSLPLLNSKQVSSIDKLYRKRRQTLLSVDDLIQNVVNTLQAKGQLANTYIFFTSDNGYHQGQHRMPSGKNTGFEEDIRIPLMVRGPGVPSHKTVDHLTANVDYASTFAEIAGVSIPSFVDGRSLMPFLRGQNPSSWRKALLLEHKGGQGSQILGTQGIREVADPWDVIGPAGEFTPNPFFGLRVDDGTTYIEYDNGDHELYDNQHDATQLRNSYNFASGWEKWRLSTWTSSMKNASGAALRAAEENEP
jgi:arylsulfatase A-like enzyme